MDYNNLEQELLKASKLYDLRRFKQSAEILRKLLSEGYFESIVFSLLAFIEFELKNFDEVVRLARKGLEMDPENADFFHLLGLVAWQKKNFKEAKEQLREAIRIEPENVSYIVAIAGVFLDKKELKKAEKIIAYGLKKAPNHPDLLRLKGVESIYENKIEEGIESLLQSLKEDPENPEMQAAVGHYYLEKRELDKAESLFMSALRKDPSIESAKDGLIGLKKQRSPIFRLFYKYGFARYTYEFTIWNVFLLIISIKGVAIFGSLFSLFLLLNWYGDVLYNSFLRLGNMSKYLLSPQQIIQSNFFLGGNIIMIGIAISAYIFRIPILINGTLFCIGIILAGIAILEVTKTTARVTIVVPLVFYCLIMWNLLDKDPLPITFLNLALIAIFGFLFTFRIIGRE